MATRRNTRAMRIYTRRKNISIRMDMRNRERLKSYRNTKKVSRELFSREFRTKMILNLIKITN